MLDNFFQMASIQSTLFLYMLVGFVCRKCNVLGDEAQKVFTDFVIYIALPCMIFQSFSTSFTSETISVGLLTIFIAAAITLFAFALGKFIFNWCKNEKQKRIMQYGTLISNAGFAGLPVVGSAYGAEGLFLASLFIIPTRILMWSAGISLFTTETLTKRIKSVCLNPGIIAVELGLIRMIFNIQMSSQIDTALTAFGNCTTPVAMLVVGLILAGVDLRKVVSFNSLFVSAIRLGGMPLIALAALKFFNVDALTTSVVIVLTGMPLGATTAILAAKYDMDASFASSCVVVSTLLSLVTVPLLTMLL